MNNTLTLILEIFQKRTNSFIRFLMVGLVNTAAGLSIMLLLMNTAGLSYRISTFFGNSAGAFLSFYLNRSFTFQSNASPKKSGIRFIAAILICYSFSFSVSHLLTTHYNHFFSILPINGKNAAILIGTGIYSISNYFVQKLYVFK